MMTENLRQQRFRQLWQALVGLDTDDQTELLQMAADEINVRLSRLKPKPADDEKKSFGADIRKAIANGLSKGDPQMVRAALEYEAEQAGREYLSKLEVSIVPYRIKDDSLAKIVLEAGDEVVAEIEEALLQRLKKSNR